MGNQDNRRVDRDEAKVTRVLFVCLGNICRSPAAHGVMQSLIDERGLTDQFEIDSAGTYSGHAGDLPDSRMRMHASRRGYKLTHRARPVVPSDLDRFDLVIGMDQNNVRTLQNMARTAEQRDRIVPMGHFLSPSMHYDVVPDPYYDGAEGFELVLDLLEDGCLNLLNSLVAPQK